MPWCPRSAPGSSTLLRSGTHSLCACSNAKGNRTTSLHFLSGGQLGDGLFLCETAIEQPLRLAFAAEIGCFGEASLGHQLDGDLDAKIALQALLQVFLQAISALGVTQQFYAHRHVVAYD